jgi:hypothetical protein
LPLPDTTLNLAEEVAVLPISKSSVMKAGAKAPSAFCQKPRVPVEGAVVVKFLEPSV